MATASAFAAVASSSPSRSLGVRFLASATSASAIAHRAAATASPVLAPVAAAAAAHGRLFSTSTPALLKARLVRRYQEALRQARNPLPIEATIAPAKARTSRTSRAPDSNSNESTGASASAAAAAAAAELELPEGVSREFFARLDNIRRSMRLDTPEASDLRLLAYAIDTPHDADLFVDAFREWRRHPSGLPHDDADNLVIFRALAAVGRHDLLLDLACRRRQFAFFPTLPQVHEIMRAFRVDAARQDADDAARLAALDNMYKCFALLLFNSIPPDAETYALLVSAGVYSRLPE
ncbi:hypothetical protein HK405_005997, partial [Cladochytrium tenue]